ncbi:MAG: phosphatase PAP2 family protein [Deltaproteobacteria bacterium]|nr:phosphatase PAP2 family protein [Deltaproteobacteria bacterium]
MQFQQAMIVWLQTYLHPQCDLFFGAVTFFGGFNGTIFLWSFFVWCVSYAAGCRLILFTQLVHYIGTLWIKSSVALPRPFETSSSVAAIIPERGYSFPSGHAINGIAYWGYLAWFVKKPWVTVVSALMILLIGLSRVYLGLHYPTDILGGWVLGGLLLFIFIRSTSFLEKYFSRQNFFVKLFWLFGSAFVLAFALIRFGPPDTIGSWAIGNCCVYLGTGLGWMAKNRWLHFEAEEGTWLQKIIRFVVGNLVLMPVISFFPRNMGTFIFASLWITFGAPALFQITGLTKWQTKES